ELADTDTAAIERFVSEAKTAAKVTHENLVETREIGREHGVFYLVQEPLDGKTAQELVDALGPLPEGDALKVAQDVATGVAEAHRKGVVYRDVKFDSVRIAALTGAVKLSDLGLARAIGRALDDVAALGTPHYMAPEQAEDGVAVGPAADVWSVGA